MTSAGAAAGGPAGEQARATAAPPPRLAGRVARHAAWNLAAIALPFAVGVLTIPVLTRELGPARFGLIGLAWAVLEYLAVFDAGLARATVHFVARELRAPGGVPGRVVLLSLGAQALLGALAGGALALAAPWLAGGVLHVPVGLQEETRRAFLVLAATVPFALLSLGLRGLLEAAERFDMVAAIRIPSSAATFVVPAAAAVGGASVPEILAALLVVRVLACLATAVVVRRVVPAIVWSARGAPGQWRGVAAFGGWVAVSNVLSPIFLLLDRAVLGVLVGVAAVGYYAGPYEAVVRLLVLPAALVTAIFPRASAAAGEAARPGEPLAALYLGTARALATPLLGLVAAAVVVAPDLLRIWLGQEYAAHAGPAMRLLLVGVLVNAMTHVPFTFVQALGRPDLTARFHLLELVVHVPLTILLVQRWSVTGAAAAWSARALLDGVLVTAAAHRLLHVRGASVFAGRWRRLLVLLALVIAASLALRALGGPAPAEHLALLGGLAALGLAYATVAWRVLLSPTDRLVLRAALARER